jgi:hypothetical protein
MTARSAEEQHITRPQHHLEGVILGLIAVEKIA